MLYLRESLLPHPQCRCATSEYQLNMKFTGCSTHSDFPYFKQLVRFPIDDCSGRTLVSSISASLQYTPRCPLASRAVFTISNARVTGGCGCTTPSCHNIPKHSCPPFPCSASLYALSFQGILSIIGSLFHGCASSTAFMNRLIPSMLVVIGPSTDNIASCPSSELTHPAYGTRLYDGLSPYKPLNADGIRTDLRSRDSVT